MELVDLSGVKVANQSRRLTRGGTPELSAFLRATRVSRDISLDAVAARTKIKRDFFYDLERNDLSKWPSNRFYQESYLRAYATAIGLDPRDVVERFRRELDVPEPEKPAAVRRAPPRRSTQRRLTPATIPIILAITFVSAYGVGRWLSREQVVQIPAEETGTAATSAPVESASAAHVETPVRASALLAESVPVPVIEPEEIAPEDLEGEIMITSTPPGAHVTVDEIGRGPTPVRVRFLSAGSHTIRFVHPEHPIVTRQVTISPERQRARVSVALGQSRATN